MTDFHTTLLQKSTGENRLNPDEQRHYLGTFRERVALLVDFSEATTPHFQAQFETLCQELAHRYQPLFLKLSPNLSDKLQVSYLKIAQESAISACIVDEKVADCPYALLFHTDHALDIPHPTVAEQLPHFYPQPATDDKKKTSFWRRLFGG